MADEKVTALVEETTPISTDLLYIVDDPGGVATSKKVEIGTLLGDDGAWVNLVQNSPGQIVTDGAEPQWWAASANATVTDEDAAGEAIPDKSERVFKVVTTANDAYGYQTLTFANEALLDAGVTVVSFSCWVYCATGNKASIGIYGTNLGLQESSQASAGAWTLLRVENITLNAADTSIQLRLIVDTDTSYFACPMLNVGSKALPWMPRGIQFVNTKSAGAVLDTTAGTTAWTNLDCSGVTHPLAVGVAVRLYANEANGTVGSSLSVGHASELMTTEWGISVAVVLVLGKAAYAAHSYVACSDAQIIRYSISEADADNDVAVKIHVAGYWRWS